MRRAAVTAKFLTAWHRVAAATHVLRGHHIGVLIYRTEDVWFARMYWCYRCHVGHPLEVEISVL